MFIYPGGDCAQGKFHSIGRKLKMYKSSADQQPFTGSIRRMGAYLIDIGILYTGVLGSQFGFRAISGGFPFTRLKTGPQIERWVFLTISLPTWFYFALSERSSKQATIGKRLCGLYVTDVAGQRLSFGRALLRTLVKLAPWEITHLSLLLPTPLYAEDSPRFRPGLIVANLLLVLYIVLAVLTPRKQSLHDLVAKTVVLERKDFSDRLLPMLQEAANRSFPPLLLFMKEQFSKVCRRLFR
jgi:uncharacterized RDD family membrane protein YckC